MADAARTEVVVPTIGESITSVFIGTWFKQQGDLIREGESLLEIDSDKASLEVHHRLREGGGTARGRGR